MFSADLQTNLIIQISTQLLVCLTSDDFLPVSVFCLYLCQMLY